LQGIDVGKSNFDVRMDCIRREIIEPRTEAIKKLLIDKSKEPMGVRRKDFWDVSMVEKLFADSFQKTLPHEIDGLVFQPVDTVCLV
jgi:mRNA-capping enzyme